MVKKENLRVLFTFLEGYGQEKSPNVKYGSGTEL